MADFAAATAQNRWSKHSYDTENSRNATRETGSGHGIIAKPATI
jgi:hypothetical protein